MPPPLHVCHAVLSLSVGGLERVVVGLVREGVRRGQRVSVLCVQGEGVLAADARTAGAEVVSLDKPPGRSARHFELATAALTRLAPDVVHTHQIGAAWYVGPGAAGRGVPVLHTEHGNPFARASGWVERLKLRLFYRRTARFAARFCCVSADIATAMGRWGTVPRPRLAVVPNGIDLTIADGLPDREEARRALGIPTDAVVVGTVGRLAEVKRQDRLLRAAAEVRKQVPKLHLLIVGDGPERANLERLAGELGLADVTTFAGYHPRPELCMRAMDLFALTSRSEGFPLTILEAWAVGVAVVSTAVGGIPDVVADGVSGRLVSEHDAAGFAAAVADALADPSVRAKWASGGAEAVQAKYAVPVVAADYERMYRELIGTKSG